MKKMGITGNPRISIIVPAYNAQGTIIPCLESLLKSDLKEIEVIVVDDGSSDETFRNVQALQKYTPRIRLYWQENCGVSAARNLGIQMARGEYIGFCDSDDWVDNEMYSTMLRQAEDKKVDLVVCDHCKDSGDKRAYESYDFPSGLIKGREYCYWLKYALTNDHLEYPMTCSVWACLFRKSVITENRILFPAGVTNGEDFIFGAQFSACAESMMYLKGFAPYHYCCIPGSASKAGSLQMIANCKKIVPLIYDTFHKYDQIPNLEDQIFLSQIRYISLAIRRMLDDKWSLKRICQNTRDLVDDTIRYRGIWDKTDYQLLIGQKILILALKLNIIELYVIIAFIKKNYLYK